MPIQDSVNDMHGFLNDQLNHPPALADGEDTEENPGGTR